MTMPLHLILVRHGEGEGNVAQKCVKGGNDGLMRKLNGVHTEKWRLSPKGRNQAIATGKWLQEQFPCGYTRYLTSWYTRAIETAGLLGLPGAKWRLHPMLSERNWGQLSSATIEQRCSSPLAENLGLRERDGLWWSPRDGESLASVLNRSHAFFDSLHREQSDGSVIIVCHGEVIWAMRLLLERTTPERFYQLFSSGLNIDHIHHGQVLHFTRVNPESTMEIHPRLDWMRSVCPWDTNRSSNEWQPIERPNFSNEQLLEMAGRYQCFMDE